MAFHDIPVLLLLLVASCSGGPWVISYVPGDMPKATNNVSCEVNGIYSVPESCRDFYQCDNWDGPDMDIYEFTCPAGSVFDDRLNICNIPKMVTTRPNCMSESDNSFSLLNMIFTPAIWGRSKRSLVQEEQFGELYLEETYQVEDSAQYDVQHVAQSAKDTCRLINYIDKYVIMVISMVPVLMPNRLQSGNYNNKISNYNIALENAQHHTYVWRNGDDIMSGIRRTYELAKLFGPRFQSKFKLTQERLRSLEESSSNIERIANLRNDIKQTENINARLLALPSDMLADFQDIIIRNNEKIFNKTNEIHKLSYVVRELEVLVIFMEFVKTDAGRIEDKANATRQNIKKFKYHIGRDRSSFSSSLKLAQRSLENLEAEKNDTEADIERLTVRLRELEEDRRQEKVKFEEIEQGILTELENMRTFLADFSVRVETINKESFDLANQQSINFASEQATKNAKEKAAQYKLDKARKDSQYFFKGVVDFFKGGDKYVRPRSEWDAIDRQRELQRHNDMKNLTEAERRSKLDLIKEEREVKFALLREFISVFETRANISNGRITQYYTNIQAQEDNIQTKRDDINTLSFVNTYIGIVITDAEKILPHIEEAQKSLMKIENIFDNIVSKLDELISKAKAVQTGAERQDINYLILDELNGMQSKWNASYADITSLGQCADDEFLQMLFPTPIPTAPTTELPVNSTEFDQLINGTSTESPINETTYESSNNFTVGNTIQVELLTRITVTNEGDSPSIFLPPADDYEYDPEDYDY